MKNQTAEQKPLYKQIAAYIEDQVNTNHLKPGDKVPSETELMNKFEVSRMTARSALNELVAKGLIKRIRGKGTFVNSALTARTAVPSPSSLIGIVVPYINAPHMASLISSIEARANSYHYQIILCNSNNVTAEETRQVEKLLALGVDGIVLYPCSQLSSRSLVRQMVNDRVNFVLIDRYYPDINTNYVVSDNEQAAFKLTSYLLEKGYDNLVFVSAFHSCITPIYDRWRGYSTAMKSFGKNGSDFLLLPYWLNSEQRAETLKNFLATAPKRTAIISSHHDISQQILSICHESSLIIPDDIGLVGFDTVKTVEPLRIDLTSANQDTDKIGVKAVDHILEGISNRKPGTYQTVIPMKFNWGNSV